MTYIPYGYGQPPGYLTQNNPYTQMLMTQPQQQPGMGMPPMMPMGFMDGNGPFGGGLFSADAAGGGASGGGGMLSGGMSGLAGSATPAVFAALIGSGKIIEHNNPDSWYGRALLSGLGPSFNQIKADHKLGWTTALGVPFINGFIRNDKAASVKPEWYGLLGGKD